MKKLFLLFGIIVFFQGCFLARDNFKPAGENGKVFKIYVNPIGNSTIQYGLDVGLMRAITNEMLFDGRLTFVNTPQEADGVLSVSITRYVREPLTYDDLLRAEQYKLEIAADISLYDFDTKEVLWMQENMRAMQIYRNPNTLSDELTAEQEARNYLWEKLSRNIVRGIVKWLADSRKND
ncbi:MAG: LPS assembly lipoprotein LptE [Elusimicrobiota bacterium]|jgi:outer membrane lipopolysaccharide assembly protein LptE/RlpB|nr:LPS assembly lipoprotein LptE [Elusimicrobiota bacterium]